MEISIALLGIHILVFFLLSIMHVVVSGMHSTHIYSLYRYSTLLFDFSLFVSFFQFAIPFIRNALLCSLCCVLPVTRKSCIIVCFLFISNINKYVSNFFDTRDYAEFALEIVYLM